MARRSWDNCAWQGDGAMQDIRDTQVHGSDAHVGARAHPNGWVHTVPRPSRRGRIPSAVRGTVPYGVGIGVPSFPIKRFLSKPNLSSVEVPLIQSSWDAWTTSCVRVGNGFEAHVLVRRQGRRGRCRRTRSGPENPWEDTRTTWERS